MSHGQSWDQGRTRPSQHVDVFGPGQYDASRRKHQGHHALGSMGPVNKAGEQAGFVIGGGGKRGLEPGQV